MDSSNNRIRSRPSADSVDQQRDVQPIPFEQLPSSAPTPQYYARFHDPANDLGSAWGKLDDGPTSREPRYQSPYERKETYDPNEIGERAHHSFEPPTSTTSDPYIGDVDDDYYSDEYFGYAGGGRRTLEKKSYPYPLDHTGSDPPSYRNPKTSVDTSKSNLPGPSSSASRSVPMINQNRAGVGGAHTLSTTPPRATTRFPEVHAPVRQSEGNTSGRHAAGSREVRSPTSLATVQDTSRPNLQLWNTDLDLPRILESSLTPRIIQSIWRHTTSLPATSITTPSGGNEGALTIVPSSRLTVHPARPSTGQQQSLTERSVIYRPLSRQVPPNINPDPPNTGGPMRVAFLERKTPACLNGDEAPTNSIAAPLVQDTASLRQVASSSENTIIPQGPEMGSGLKIPPIQECVRPKNLGNKEIRLLPVDSLETSASSDTYYGKKTSTLIGGSDITRIGSAGGSSGGDGDQIGGNNDRTDMGEKYHGNTNNNSRRNNKGAKKSNRRRVHTMSCMCCGLL